MNRGRLAHRPSPNRRSKTDEREGVSDDFEEVPVALLRVDESGSVVNANREARALLGIPTETGPGEDWSWTQILDPSSLDAFRGHIRRVIEFGKREEVEMILNSQPWGNASFQIRSIRCRASGGKSLCLSALIKAPAPDNHPVEPLHSFSVENPVFEFAPVILMVIDHTGRVLQMTAEARRIFANGLPTRADERPHIFDWMDTDSLRGRFGSQILRNKSLVWAQIAREMVQTPSEWNLRPESAPSFLAKVSLTPLVKSNGKDDVYLLFARNISEDRHLREELRRLAIVAEKTGNCVIITDNKHAIEWVNEAFERETEFTLEEVRGKNPRFLHGPLTNHQTHLEMRRLLHRGLPVQCDILNYRKSGQTFWNSLSITPVLNEEGAIERFIGIQTNITARKMAEEQARRALQEFKELHSMKLHLVANVSHELRTPMNGVMGLTELLSGTDLSLEQQEYVSSIRNCAQKMLGLIADILTFSDGTHGDLKLDLHPVNLTTLLQDCVATLSLAHGRPNLQIEADLDPRLPPFVRTDQECLRKICENLLNNALKFSEQGSIKLRVSALPKDRIRIEVHDNGIGIPVDQQSEIFTPFFQGDASSSRAFGGTGLGLAITKILVERMGGSIHFSSLPGYGTCFACVIPVNHEPSHTDEATAPRPPRVTGGSNGVPRRVLVVDDNPLNLKLTTRLFGKRCKCVNAASSGAMAIHLHATDPYDLIIMDCQMPLMDGYATTRAIRAMERSGGRQRSRIVALTANAFPEDRQKCLAAGMDDYFTKPLTWQIVDAVLENGVEPDQAKT